MISGHKIAIILNPHICNIKSQFQTTKNKSCNIKFTSCDFIYLSNLNVLKASFLVGFIHFFSGRGRCASGFSAPRAALQRKLIIGGFSDTALLQLDRYRAGAGGEGGRGGSLVRLSDPPPEEEEWR